MSISLNSPWEDSERRPHLHTGPSRIHALSSIGKPLVLVLRDGMVLHLPLLAVGPFDLLLGWPGNEVLVHLHAITF
ncbi:MULTISPECIES: hypothetical protein [Corallococcus]|uniref:Uncharacterized protein n=1 Tax=Corallococcus caeni TaxID=3082388 RepID=A0ABQ6QXP5_9BACT|nr:hypothetical protein [Corallococcus sp. BB11-1]MCY1033298.1 hypothetical protein [Corallococcus sp. BB11-1]GMU08771.1 hypothetical protein ASNO1_50240 [Corallococcus sp. NO1]